ncbi:uncharacterized protein STEHIDRAFT_142410 [Stereum hirsutum FP-91666 SS1]|uniref:uncharacterized protein n=1 Tax=Stereum hirsutum (strain FP-91666) TaxID=721885 RepID=UPI000444A389|nr:uncharacterized protein STEHIDRAFT_142410 [Stereum hirsutum FP-91666 SS1]EIM81174.1 hypothetical protein STEHIDRAFT_142410 [Stereum hirsutum FP-91666 SS1]
MSTPTVKRACPYAFESVDIPPEKRVRIQANLSHDRPTRPRRAVASYQSRDATLPSTPSPSTTPSPSLCLPGPTSTTTRVLRSATKSTHPVKETCSAKRARSPENESLERPLTKRARTHARLWVPTLVAPVQSRGGTSSTPTSSSTHPTKSTRIAKPQRLPAAADASKSSRLIKTIPPREIPPPFKAPSANLRSLSRSSPPSSGGRTIHSTATKRPRPYTSELLDGRPTKQVRLEASLSQSEPHPPGRTITSYQLRSNTPSPSTATSKFLRSPEPSSTTTRVLRSATKSTHPTKDTSNAKRATLATYTGSAPAISKIYFIHVTLIDTPGEVNSYCKIKALTDIHAHIQTSSQTPPSKAPSTALPSLSQDSPPSSGDCMVRPTEDRVTPIQPGLQRRHRNVFNLLCSGSLGILRYFGLHELIMALGLWPGSRNELFDFHFKHQELYDIYLRASEKGDLYELCTYPALQNPVDPIIERVSSECDSLFQHIRNGNLPSASFSTHPDAAPQHLGNLDDLDTAEALKRADQIFSSQRAFVTATSSAKSRLLAQDLLQHWGFYFSFTSVATCPVSKDLELAAKMLDMRLTTSQPGDDKATIAQECFYALYLARVIVFSEFLDSLPDDLSEEQARKEWLYFQLAPPRASGDSEDDVFATVFRAISTSDPEDIRKSAKGRMISAPWKHYKWFPKSIIVFQKQGDPLPLLDERTDPPLHLIIDEITPPGAESSEAYASRRARRFRELVYALFWPEAIA